MGAEHVWPKVVAGYASHRLYRWRVLCRDTAPRRVQPERNERLRNTDTGGQRGLPTGSGNRRLQRVTARHGSKPYIRILMNAINSLIATPDRALDIVPRMSKVVNQALGLRLAAARQKARLSQPQLAEKVGMTQSAIAEIEGGRVKRPKKLREIAKAVGQTEEWLLDEDPRPPLISSFDPDQDDGLGSGGTDRPDLLPGITGDGRATVIVPKGGVVEVDIEPGLGGGGLATETYVRTPDGNQFPADAIRGIWQLPDHVFTQMRARSQNVRCFPVQGDSMLDTLDEGDFVFVDVAHKVPSPPGIYALDDGFGGVIVKRLEVVDEDDGEPIVRVISDNDRYAERRERADSLRIVGRYIAMFTMRNRR